MRRESSVSSEITKKNEREISRLLLSEIKKISSARKKERKKTLRLMEVCGTHTVSIFRSGLRHLLKDAIDLVSGPGCPVCVTPDSYVDTAIFYAAMEDVIIATFGDMMKVPGTASSLAKAKAAGGDVRVIYSPLDAIAVAKENPSKKVVFLAVGFETTIPTTAAAVLQAEKEGTENFFLLTAQKLVPPAMVALLESENADIDGFILPGHVSAVTGSQEFSFLPEKYNLPGVVTGFSTAELIRGIYRLARMAASGEARVENEYRSVVRSEGNPVAKNLTAKVFETENAEWRGLGIISASGLKLNGEYRRFDFSVLRPADVSRVSPEKKGCLCGDVLRGKVIPANCPLFGKACVPEHAAGPCMVSAEGVCAAWFKYGGGVFDYG